MFQKTTLLRICFVVVVVFTLSVLSISTNRNPVASTVEGSDQVQLGYLLYPSSSNRQTQTVSVEALALTNNRIGTSAPSTVGRTTQGVFCDADAVVASPDEAYLLIQHNCHDRVAIEVIDANSQEIIAEEEGFFLTWLSDYDIFLFKQFNHPRTVQFRHLAADTAHYISIPKDTYEAVVHPDQTNLIFFAVNQGLGHGSWIGVFDIETAEYAVLETFPDEIVAQMEFAPNGRGMSFATIPDSNIPFQAGDLWVVDIEGLTEKLFLPTVLQKDTADNSQCCQAREASLNNVAPMLKFGQPRFISKMDGGHGYAAKWSPDSSQIAFVVRENLDSPIADNLSAALHSNIYVADLTADDISRVTNFDAMAVYDIAWSPTGSHIAFTADDGVWLSSLTGELTRVTTAAVDARHPIWLTRQR